MDYKRISKKLINFIDKSPNAFFAIENMKNILIEKGFEELPESEKWTVRSGGKYFVTRNASSIIAFKLPKKEFIGFNIMASHSDSPSFRIKSNPDISSDNKYIKLNIEKYGGMIMAPWFDRPLSIAGRVILKTSDGIESRLIDIDRDLLIIPNLAIHMNREINEGYKFNAQNDMPALFSEALPEESFNSFLAGELKADEDSILDYDLFLYNRMKGTILGANEEFIASARLDDLQCAFASLTAFIDSKSSSSIPLHCVFDNEEVGSGTKQGADSTFLSDTLSRILFSVGKNEEDLHRLLASSFMISADNAHAVHPNYTGKADPTNRPYLNEGIVIKYSANQKYTTDAVSAAIMKEICNKAKVPYQTFTNRSDMAGGSTLGNISNSHIALNTVDIGLPQLAMHSPYETAGVKDTAYLIEAAKVFFSSSIVAKANGNYQIMY